MNPRKFADPMRAVGRPVGENRSKRVRRGKLYALDGLAAILFLVSLVKLSEPVSVFFAKALSRPYRAAAGFLTSLLPFSVTELLTVAAVLVAVGFFVAMIGALVRKKGRKFLDLALTVALIAASVAALYSVTAQFDYSRPAPAKPWFFEDAEVGEYREIVVRYARRAGELASSFEKDENGFTIAPTFQETAEKLRREVQKYTGGDFGYLAPLPKQVGNSWFLDLTGIVGVTFAPTNEVNMNKNISPLDLPYYMAHELAHGLGIMSEREANVFAAFVTLASEDPYLRYSGYRMLIYDLIAPIRSLDLPKDYSLVKRISEAAAHYGVPFDSGSDDPGEILSEIYRRAGADAKAVSDYVFGKGETEIAFDEALGADFMRDGEIANYTPDLPEWMSDMKSVFNRLGEWVNNLYLKASGLGDGTGNYNTGSSTVIEPPRDPDTGLPDGAPKIAYSETVKIFLWLDRAEA